MTYTLTEIKSKSKEQILQATKVEIYAMYITIMPKGSITDLAIEFGYKDGPGARTIIWRICQGKLTGERHLKVVAHMRDAIIKYIKKHKLNTKASPVLEKEEVIL